MHVKKLSLTFSVLLVSAGIKLIFFFVAGIVLCFGFRMTIMLITHCCSSCCYAVFILSHGLFSFSYCPASGGWGCTRSGEETQPGQRTQTGQRGIPCHMTSLPVYKLGRVGWGHHGSGIGWASVSRWWAIVLCITSFVSLEDWLIILLFSSEHPPEQASLNPWSSRRNKKLHVTSFSSAA